MTTKRLVSNDVFWDVLGADQHLAHLPALLVKSDVEGVWTKNIFLK